MQFHPEASHEIFQVRKRISSISFAMPFYTQNDHFTKTGSGQTWENALTKKICGFL